MRLGFNWPLGPLEFAELIGVERAVGLLERAAQAATARPTGRLPACSPRPAAELMPHSGLAMRNISSST